jgi:hypothetical protein
LISNFDFPEHQKIEKITVPRETKCLIFGGLYRDRSENNKKEETPTVNII